MLDKLTKDSFSPYLGQAFRVQLDPNNALELELTEVTAFDSRSEQPDSSVRRHPFSILFRGPADTSRVQRSRRFKKIRRIHPVLFEIP